MLRQTLPVCFIENKVLLGWFSSESFERLLDEVSVV